MLEQDHVNYQSLAPAETEAPTTPSTKPHTQADQPSVRPVIHQPPQACLAKVTQPTGSATAKTVGQTVHNVPSPVPRLQAVVQPVVLLPPTNHPAISVLLVVQAGVTPTETTVTSTGRVEPQLVPPRIVQTHQPG